MRSPLKSLPSPKDANGRRIIDESASDNSEDEGFLNRGSAMAKSSISDTTATTTDEGTADADEAETAALTLSSVSLSVHPPLVPTQISDKNSRLPVPSATQAKLTLDKLSRLGLL